MGARCFTRGQSALCPRVLDSPTTTLPRAGVFGLLASMFLCKPTREALLGWRALLKQDPPAVLGELKEALEHIDVASTQGLEALLWEYTRLFLGPYRLPAPPWESVYTSPARLLMQEAYDAVRAMHRQAGLTVGDGNVLADHIGAELQFLALLLARAETEGEEDRDLAGRFFREHIQNWIPRFSADLEGAASVPLYESLARAVRGVASSAA